MAKKQTTSNKLIKNYDQKLQKNDNYLETQKEHKKWYEVGAMGKQRGKPHAISPNIKKSKSGRNK